MATPPSGSEEGKRRSESRQRPISFYPRFSNLPGTPVIPSHGADLFDVSGYRPLTVEATESEDLTTWADPDATPPDPEGGPEAEGPADSQPPAPEED